MGIGTLNPHRVTPGGGSSVVPLYPVADSAAATRAVGRRHERGADGRKDREARVAGPHAVGSDFDADAGRSRSSPQGRDNLGRRRCSTPGSTSCRRRPAGSLDPHAASAGARPIRPLVRARCAVGAGGSSCQTEGGLWQSSGAFRFGIRPRRPSTYTRDRRARAVLRAPARSRVAACRDGERSAALVVYWRSRRNTPCARRPALSTRPT
jgi:hypothetical protein